MNLGNSKSETRPLSFIKQFATGWMSAAAHLTFKDPYSFDKITNAMLSVRKRNPLLRCIIKSKHILVIFSRPVIKEI